MTPTKTKICINCNLCKGMYQNSQVFFFKRETYLCLLGNKIVDKSDSCDNWQKREYNYDVSVERIDEVIKDVEWLLDNMPD